MGAEEVCAEAVCDEAVRDEAVCDEAVCDGLGSPSYGWLGWLALVGGYDAGDCDRGRLDAIDSAAQAEWSESVGSCRFNLLIGPPTFRTDRSDAWLIPLNRCEANGFGRGVRDQLVASI